MPFVDGFLILTYNVSRSINSRTDSILQGKFMSILAFLSPQDVESIQAASLKILQETGIRISFPEALELLDGAGAAIKGDRALLPPELILSSLHLCPPSFVLKGRGGQAVTLGTGELQWHNLGGAPDVYQAENNLRRPAGVADVQNAARLLDALPNCTTITPFFTPQDVPGETLSLAMYRHTIPHTSKPIHGPGVQRPDEVRWLARMAEVIGPPAEVLSIGISPISPLYFPDDIAGAIIATARLGIPFGPLPCPTAGATAPLSLAGALAQQNAEVLAAIVLAQAVHPGLAVFYCGRLAVMDPHSGGAVWGGVELGLVSAATVQIAHSYQLPVNVYGFTTNAHDLSFQTGFERTLNAVLPALAGADELSGIGELSAGLTGSYTQMVLDDEIAGGIRRLGKGLAVDSDRLAVDQIGEVLAGPGNFLSQKQTVEYLREGEIYIPELADRRNGWIEDRDAMVENARLKADRLLHDHQPEALEPVLDRELEAILVGAQKDH
jgi:trimethylamine--corrinoid protein Co-methyltransferase